MARKPRYSAESGGLGLKIEAVPVEDLVPYAANARMHNEDQVRQIAESIKAFGFNNPVLIDPSGEIIAGHGRVMAAKLLNLGEVPAIRLPHMDEAKRRAYRLADNRIALNSTWDESLLAAELAALKLDDFDIALLGFDSSELDALLNPEDDGDGEGEEIPPLEEREISKLGDTWILGRHRLRCGSSTEPEHVAALLGDAKPSLMVTDPPYGVEYDPSWRADAGVNKNQAKMGKVLNDDRADWREAWALFPGNVAYVWHAGLFAGEVAESLRVCGFSLRSQIIWAKDRFALGRSNYHWQHEPCWYAVRDGAAASYVGGRSQSTLWTIKAREDSGHGHGTQKPLECMRRPIINNSKRGGLVYEPFCGSGTTLIASEMTERVCFAMELSPAYVDLIVRRWQELTGLQAKLEATGRSFAEVSAERSAPDS